MYKYNENTLLHSAGVNFCAIESIMRNGIVSERYGKEHGISINRNYFGSNLDDTISCVRYLYVNDEVEDSAYSSYIQKGISFIMEDVPFIYDKGERVIHRSDEVLVEDFIPKEKIKGIGLPSNIDDFPLWDHEFIKEKSTAYVNIKKAADQICAYIKEKSGLIRDYNEYYEELYLLNEEFKTASDYRKKSIKEVDFPEVIRGLNTAIGLDYYDCFSVVLGKDDVTISDIINYINKETLNVPVYEIRVKDKGKGPR